MSLALIIYLIHLGEGLVFLSALLSVLLGCAGVFHYMASCDQLERVKMDRKGAEEMYQIYRKRTKNLAISALVLVILSCVIPGKSTSYTMLAAHGIEAVATSERAVGISDNTLKVLEKFLGDYLKEGEE
jgi:predicted transcriptional regulator